jgi:hypothetical protein
MISHKQHVKLISIYGPHTLILLHIPHIQSQRRIRILSQWVEVFNDVIVLS